MNKQRKTAIASIDATDVVALTDSLDAAAVILSQLWQSLPDARMDFTSEHKIIMSVINNIEEAQDGLEEFFLP